MTTLSEVLSSNRAISKEVTPSLLVGVDLNGNTIAATFDADGKMLVSTSGATSSTTIKETYSFKYSSVNITTGAWVQIIASTSAIIKEWDIFSGTGEVVEIGTGTVGNEVRFALIGPGGATFSHQIAAGSRIALRAVTGTANAGDFSMNAWG